MKIDWKNPPRALMIALLAVIAIGLGFLADFIITCLEKNAYPREYAEYVEVYAEQYGVPEALVFGGGFGCRSGGAHATHALYL